MRMDQPKLRWAGAGTRNGGGLTSFLSKLATFTVAGLFLAGAFMISLLVFAVGAVLALLIGGYLLWKTRALRKQLREGTRRERVVEGEVIPSGSADQR